LTFGRKKQQPHRQRKQGKVFHVNVLAQIWIAEANKKSGEEKDTIPNMTPEDGLEKATELISESITKRLASTLWKERLAGTILCDTMS
jgi:hypothetical protein